MVADLAEQLALVNAAGRAYASVTPETLRVEIEGAHLRLVPVAPVVQDGPDGALAAAGVWAAGTVLGELLGAPPAGDPVAPRPNAVPATWWDLVRDATAAAPADRPAAAVLASWLRAAERDLLLGLTPDAAAADTRSPTPPPRYLPDQAFAAEPVTAGGPWRRHGRTLMVAATTAVAALLAAGGILLPVAGVRLPPLGGALTARTPPVAVAVSPEATRAATQSPTPAATKTACCAVTGYHVEGGSAIFDVRGTLIWYDRSVGVSGVVKSRTPCASATYSGLAGGKQVANYQSPARCGSVAVQTTLGATAATGAISEVDVTLYVGGKAAGQERCLRQTHACSAA